MDSKIHHTTNISFEDMSGQEYCLGISYFEYTLAQKAFRLCRGTPVNDLTPTQERLKRQYHYDQTLDLLRTKGLAPSSTTMTQTHDSCETLMKVIGSILSADNMTAIQHLATILRTYEPGHDSNSASSLVSAAESQTSNRESIEAGNYISLLKEFSDRTGISVDYRYFTLSASPSLYEAHLQYGNLLFKAQASTKKMAKHLASEKACDKLELRLM